MEHPSNEETYTRSSCVVCKHPDFETVYSLPHFPIMAISNNNVSETYYDYHLIVCNQCKCLQLKYLTDPSILYSDIYLNATFSPSWADHDTHFSNFILSNTQERVFLEVGANKGGLYKRIKNERDVEFMALDMFKHDELPSEIKFIKGNCETFNFTGYNNLILSHVFEHLYEPHTFIKNICSTGVSNVFISIPNFDMLVKEKSLIIITSQHTFYCGFEHIVYMFSLYNYSCYKSYMYNGNIKSMMFKFVLNATRLPESIPWVDSQLYRKIYVDKIHEISKAEIPENTYIIPSGMYGQLYYYLIKDKERVVGFLDNDAQRHNNRLYGTDKLVYSPSTIDFRGATVAVCDCPYKDEIITGLMKICSSINIIYI